MAHKTPWHIRVLLRILPLRWSEQLALRDADKFRPIARFTLLFGVTVVVPAALLSYFALTSIRTQGILTDTEMERRAEGLIQQTREHLAEDLEHFEAEILQRLRTERDPLSELDSASPHLRAAFQLDEDGTLLAPFSLPSPSESVEATTAYVETIRRALKAEEEAHPREAAEIYGVAAAHALTRARKGAARLGMARTLWKAGRIRDAREALARLSSDFRTVRDPRGFLIADLASLMDARILASYDPPTSRTTLRELVDDMLSRQWTIGERGEPTVAGQALSALRDTEDPLWLSAAEEHLVDRTSRLYWSSFLVDDLELFAGPATRRAVGNFNYLARPESSVLWAHLWTGDTLYAYAFDYDAILSELHDATVRLDESDDNVTVSLLEARQKRPEHLLARQSLSPWLPYVLVTASATDPARLESEKSQKRRAQMVIVVLAIGLSVLGVFSSGRLLRTELEAVRVKADFAANVSHELRSPITQIRLKAESLQLDLVRDEDDRRAHYDTIVRESERLSRLVDNVLDFASIERGAKRYSLRRDDLGDIIHKAIDAARNDLALREITIEEDVSHDLPTVYVDRDAIGQVLTNLLSNAAKYGGDGRWIGVKARLGLDGVDISVSDRGIGIPEEEQAKIFEHFFRSSDPQVRRRKGTGIGLTIVRYIVEAHGGAISVDSTPGEGTTFTLTLPLTPPEPTGV